MHCDARTSVSVGAQRNSPPVRAATNVSAAPAEFRTERDVRRRLPVRRAKTSRAHKASAGIARRWRRIKADAQHVVEFNDKRVTSVKTAFEIAMRLPALISACRGTYCATQWRPGSCSAVPIRGMQREGCTPSAACSSSISIAWALTRKTAYQASQFTS